MAKAARPTVWLTGLSGAGKTTLGRGLVARLVASGTDAVLLDAEDLRARPGWPTGHDLADRFEVLRRIVEEAAKESAGGRVAVVATISHLCRMRAWARDQLAAMVEVRVSCPPEVCAARDTKGVWARARRGEYACFVGVTEPYEETDRSDVLVVDTATLGPDAAADALFAELRPRLG